MAKSRTAYSCTACGAALPRWEGRCPRCETWDSLVEVVAEAAPRHKAASTFEGVQEMAQVRADAFPRLPLPFPEIARVLGGGLVPGSVVLLAGEPGIGKSTLLLQMAQAVATEGAPVVYVSGEESPHQVKLRADRLGLSGRGVLLVGETDVEALLRGLDTLQARLVVVDSVQTLSCAELQASPGTVAQVRECASRLTEWAKRRNVPVLLSGHVTKEGIVAGPRVLEHGVDVVLYLEGETGGPYRFLRGTKNRFGSTHEVAVLEMGEEGLREVADPSQAFLAERSPGGIGSAVVPVLEGSRCLLMEVQALVSPSLLPAPRRVANGVEFNRLLLVLAVLSRRTGLPVANQDVLVNVVGGLSLEEPAADLGIALAVASSLRGEPVASDLVAMGEIGLSGEVRSVGQVARRLAEAERLGFRRALAPGSTAGARAEYSETKRIEALPVGTVRQALHLAFAHAVSSPSA